MPDYRLYCLGDDGRFTSVLEITANDDSQALMIARGMKLPVKCELWERARKIATLDPHSGSC